MKLGSIQCSYYCVLSSECERWSALLEESVRVLLHCLETVDTDLVVRKGYFSWEVKEGVKCACFLKRIYEEVSGVDLAEDIYFQILDTLFKIFGYFHYSK